MKNMYLILLISLCTVYKLQAQPFIEQSEIDLQGLDYSIPTWVDYDNDGDLDIFLSGYNGAGYSLLYRNDGENTFTGFPNFNFVTSNVSSSALGDYDNDGDIDIAVTNYGQETFIYENIGNNSFVKNTDVSMTEAGYGSIDWGDYNNNGRLDVLLTGSDDWGNYITEVWVNQRKDLFYRKYDDTLHGVDVGSGKWGDFDNDGDLDILLTGGTGNSITDLTTIYSNDGHNLFSKLVELCNYVGNAEWGDYNNDGYLDVIVTGGGIDGHYTGVYKNNGNNTFSHQNNISIVGTNGGGKAIWGDYNNDGFLDIAINGYGNGNYYLKLYKNDQNGNFEEETEVSLEAFNGGECAWGDYDNDGDIDLLTSGDFKTKLYRNDIITKNYPPSAPTNLKSTIYNDSITLIWAKSTDDKTPQDGLSYNLYLYKVTNDSLVYPPHAHTYRSDFNGFRLISQIGKIQWSEKGYTLYGQFSNEYKWSVQAIDAGFAGSPFAAEQYLGINTNIDINCKQSDLKIYPNPVSSGFNISLNKPYETIVILNLQGVKCKSIHVTQRVEVIDVSDLAEGIYILQAISIDNIINTTKFIKQK